MNRENKGLEDFIRDHRQEFDDLTPSRRVWDGIEHRLDQDHRGRIVPFMILRIAAMVVLVLACGIVIGVNLTGRHSSDKMDYTSSQDMMQLKDAETYYQQQVNFRMGQLKNSDDKAVVEEDLKQLDIIYQELRQEMIRSGYSNSDVLINAMITNYKTRIDLLENILNKQNTHRNETKPETL